LPVFSGIVALAAMLFVCPGPAAHAEKADTVSIEGKIGRDGKRVKIHISDEGISVEAGEGHEKVIEARDGETVSGETSRRRNRERSNDIVKFGEDVFVDKDEVVAGDLVVFGGDATVLGRVMGDVVVFGGDLNLRSGAEINGEAVVIGGKLKEDSDAVIQGERVVINTWLPVWRLGGFIHQGTTLIGLVGVVVKFIFVLILSSLALLFMKERVKKSRDFLNAQYLRSFGWGFAISFGAIFIIPVLLILLAITIIGIPLDILIAFLLVGVLILAWTVFAYDLGKRLDERLDLAIAGPFWILAVGMAALHLPIFVGYGLSMFAFLSPVGLALRILGKVIFLFAFVTGLGALVMSKFGKNTITFSDGESAPPPAAPAGE
jgi:hypothetical protein